MKENYPIDFVVTWVDGNDPEWQKEHNKYYKSEKDIDASLARVRDWDNMQYWFRALEKFAPWVNKIHFVTWGHTPKWLNTSNPKLNIVKHTDFIPSEYLPTFNSWVITWNTWRIKGLAKHFVNFADDVFIGHTITPNRFFRNGIPCDLAQLAALEPVTPQGNYLVSTLEILHKRHNVLKSVLSHPAKWFNPKYGLKNILKTAYLLPYANFASLKNPHVTIPYQKAEFETLWQAEFETLNNMCYNKFRTPITIMHWLTRYERLVKGEFKPISFRDTNTCLISDKNASEIADYITKQKYALFCINDSNDIVDFERTKNIINSAFEKLLPQKSSFEL